MNLPAETTAIVTGAGQGVGRGIALALAKAGAQLAVLGRTLEKCARTVAEIEAIGGTACAFACDVSQRPQVDTAVAAVLTTFGRVDVLVNNAHTSRPLVPLAETGADDLAIAFAGFHGAVAMMQACYPHLPKPGGVVINIGSVAGIRGDAGFAAYAASKEALRAISRVAAREWGPLGITVNTLCPYSDSPGIDYMIRKNLGFIDTLTAQTALGRLGDSERDVGAAAVFLASQAGAYVTGQTLNVDGGIWIAP
jgi:NAD(P)-dependent dehydrogenase (short-subunit alcohol dehydrogenase family)